MIWSPVWWILAVLPALIALYFLKLKRRNVVVSSTLLWMRSVEDFRVNAPFRRLRRNWMLFLQILILAGLILALWRPRITGSRGASRDLVVLIDNSASMAAREKDGSRMQLAKGAALDLLGGMQDGDRMTLLAFSSRTVSLGPATADRNVLRSRIEGLQTTALPTDLAQALEVAGAVAENLSRPLVHVIGDGCYGDMSTLPDAVKRLNIRLTGIGSRLENLGITEIDVRRSFEVEQRTEVLAVVENTGRRDARTVVSLEVNGALADAREISPAAGEKLPVVFDVSDVQEATIRVALDVDDALAVDNEAWVRIPPRRKISVLIVGNPNPWVELALKATGEVRYRRMSLDAFLATARETAGGEAGETGPIAGKLDADVLVFDREAPPGQPFLPAIYIGCHPPLPPGLPAPRKVKNPVIVDSDRTHALHRFLVFTDLYIKESLVFQAGGAYRSLVDTEEGSIIGILRYRSPEKPLVTAVVIGFDILASNWPVSHYSYPIFFNNAVRWLGTSESDARSRWRTGGVLAYRPKAGEVETAADSRFRTPSGAELPAVREEGSLTFSQTDEAGMYDLLVGGDVRCRFPVALLSSSETRLEPSARIDFGDFSVSVADRVVEGGRELWKWFALGALAMLLLEWLASNRRLW